MSFSLSIHDISMLHHQDAVEACKTGDRKAQFEIYQRYSQAMFGICLRIINDSSAAEDVLQEVFLQAFQQIQSYRGEASFGAWLKRIAVNKSINYVKKRRLEIVPIEKAKAFEDDTTQVRDDDEMMVYQIEQVKKAVQELPDGFRIVFSLYLLEGYDHSEIAEILGISESTSKSQYNRAKVRLRELLKKYS